MRVTAKQEGWSPFFLSLFVSALPSLFTTFPTVVLAVSFTRRHSFSAHKSLDYYTMTITFSLTFPFLLLYFPYLSSQEAERQQSPPLPRVLYTRRRYVSHRSPLPFLSCSHFHLG